MLPEYLKIVCVDTKLFTDHSVAMCQFLKDKVVAGFFVGFVFFCFRITEVFGRVSEDKKFWKESSGVSPRLIKIHRTSG